MLKYRKYFFTSAESYFTAACLTVYKATPKVEDRFWYILEG